MARVRSDRLNEQLLTFRVASEQFGVPTSLVREVARLPRITRVPHAPDTLLGLGNFRGTVLPVLSFARLTDRTDGNESRVILLNTANPIGLAVDEVVTFGGGAVQAIDAEALASAGFASARSAKNMRVTSATTHIDTAIESEIPLAVFAVANQEFALPVGSVQEVLRVPDKFALMPQSDSAVIGSIAVRDVLLPVLSLSALLALPGSDNVDGGRIVVVQIGSHRVGLMVDAMRAILRVPESRIDPVPAVLARGGAETRIQAICRLEEGRRLISVLAVDHLVREDLTARLVDTAGADEMTKQATGEATEQFLIFTIGDADFGMPIASVVEVTALPARLTRLPKAPAFVRGIMNLRGLAVPVIDQSLRFVGRPAKGARRRVIVVRLGELQAGFVVDTVSEVRSMPASALGPAPQLRGDETRVFDRVANLEGDDRMILIVSPKELLDRAERELLISLSEKPARAS